VGKSVWFLSFKCVSENIWIDKGSHNHRLVIGYTEVVRWVSTNICVVLGESHKNLAFVENVTILFSR